MTVTKRTLAIWAPQVPPLLWGLRAAHRLLAPRHWVGAVGAVFDDEGRVLLLEHVFRTDFPWGLPGGWISRGEDPAETVRREAREELRLAIEVRRLLLTGRVPVLATSAHPPHLGIAFYCRASAVQCTISGEILSVRWADPHALGVELAPFQRAAVELGCEAFDDERRALAAR